MTPTEQLLQAAACLDVDARLGREPRSEWILAGLAASQQPIPTDGRDAARRFLATAGWLRSWAAHEPEDRATALTERAEAQDVMAALAVATGTRYAA
jgi:hypothetical protein